MRKNQISVNSSSFLLFLKVNTFTYCTNLTQAVSLRKHTTLREVKLWNSDTLLL